MFLDEVDSMYEVINIQIFIVGLVMVIGIVVVMQQFLIFNLCIGFYVILSSGMIV